MRKLGRLDERSGRVLLVMDDDLHRAILEKRLEAFGLAVRCLSCAAVGAGEALPPADVIFLDQRPGPADAPGALARLRE